MKKKDWRIGLSVKPKMRTPERYYEPPGKVVDVYPSGYMGLFDKDGILMIDQNGVTFLARADEWMTA